MSRLRGSRYSSRKIKISWKSRQTFSLNVDRKSPRWARVEVYRKVEVEVDSLRREVSEDVYRLLQWVIRIIERTANIYETENNFPITRLIYMN